MKAAPGATKSKSTTKSSPLQTVDRALQILATFSVDQPAWGVSELASHFGWDKSTAQRLLASLAARDFLVSDPVTRRYQLGPQVWHLAQFWERSGGLAEFVIPTMRELAYVSRRDVLFAIPDGSYLRCIAEVSGVLGSIRITPIVGELYPGHAGATSRAYFAFLDRTTRHHLLMTRPKAKYSELTITDDEHLESLFTETATKGYAYSDGEYDPSTRALAVPVRIGNMLLGSLSVVERKLDQPDNLLDYLPHLLESANELGTRLTGSRSI